MPSPQVTDTTAEATDWIVIHQSVWDTIVQLEVAAGEDTAGGEVVVGGAETVTAGGGVVGREAGEEAPVSAYWVFKGADSHAFVFSDCAQKNIPPYLGNKAPI